MITVLSLLFIKCSKNSGNSQATANNGNDTTIHHIVDTPKTPSPPVDTTKVPTTPSLVITYVMGVTDIGVVFTGTGSNLTLSRIELNNQLGGGSKFYTGGNLSFKLRNCDSSITYLDVDGLTPCVKFLNVFQGDADKLKKGDTTGALFEVNNLDIKTYGCDRLLLVLCQTLRERTGVIGIQSQQSASIFTNAFVRNAFNGSVTPNPLKIKPIAD